MKLSNEWYDFLRLFAGTLLPAFAAFYETLAEIWGLPFAEKIPPSLMALVVVLNAYLDKASKTYYESKMNDGIMDVEAIAHQVPVEVLDDSEEG